VVAVRDDRVVDLTSRDTPTLSELFNTEDPLGEVRGRIGYAPVVGSLADVLANSAADRWDEATPRLLSPSDLQAIKASGVTFVASLLERVIEEQAAGDAGRAESIRAAIHDAIGTSLASVRPGSDEAMRLKQELTRRGVWSQYLEVGIGPDAEIFTKCQPMSSVGTGAEIGVLESSSWNNPEPEVVLAVSGGGDVVGATLGNDVNLRDIEGRSALLLGKAKDNNASCSMGPFVRLFDEDYGLDDVHACEVALTVEGVDGYRLTGHSSMREISRTPRELVNQAIGPHHRYPDGLMLFLGTMFAPVEDRDEAGQGFTHHMGDLVEISTPALGSLVNRVNRCGDVAPWTFASGALMRNLAARGLL